MNTRVKSIIFNEEEHKYLLDGRELFGVTGAIGKLMGKSFPDTDTVKLAAMYGSDIHKEVENYYNAEGKLSTDGAKTVVKILTDFMNGIKDDNVTDVSCEVMVSDFKSTASKVDIVLKTGKGKAYLFDIKTTTHFDRAYCSLQLSVYKKLYTMCYDEEVSGLYVIGTKSGRLFRILEQEAGKVQKILDMNRGI